MGVLGESVSSGLATGLGSVFGEPVRISGFSMWKLCGWKSWAWVPKKGVFLADFAEVGLDRFW